MGRDVSSGFVVFKVKDVGTSDVRKGLAAQGIVATTTPYYPPLPRLAPCVLNTEEEIDHTIEAVRQIA